MGILFGHPTGNPNSHQAALAHFERDRLEAFCVPWMPTPGELLVLGKLPGLRSWTARLQRRSFAPLRDAPKIEGRLPEWIRMAKRVIRDGPVSTERLAYEANDWLMKTMARECKRSSVSAVHSYEDCSLDQFRAAKKLGKACIYDMPIGYYPAWQQIEQMLALRYRDWLPQTGLSSRHFVRPEQKKEEIELADIVFVPSRFVEGTIHQFIDKTCVLARYGVDSDFWTPSETQTNNSDPLRFIFAGQVSLRKGAHLLMEAWKKANLPDAELLMVGRWDMADHVRRRISKNIHYLPACSKVELRDHYRSADVFVFPSYFEGFGLVLLEAMACGLPFIASTSSGAASELAADGTGSILPTGDVDALIEALRDFSNRRNDLPQLKLKVCDRARQYSWEQYRKAVARGVDSLM